MTNPERTDQDQDQDQDQTWDQDQTEAGVRVNGHCAHSSPLQTHRSPAGHRDWSLSEPGDEERTAGGMKVTHSGEEDRGLLESSVRLKPREAQSWRVKALCVSWVSVVITAVLAIAAFVVSFLRNSSSAFGFAFDACLDVLSSVIVLWRYNNAAAVHSAHREHVACLVLGVLFILSSFCIMGKAVDDLVSQTPPELDDFLLSVSVLSGALCSVLAVIKMLLGRILTSRALITDGFNSLVGALIGFSILLGAEVYKFYPEVWFLDGVCGLLIGLLLFAYGVKLLVDMVPRVRLRNYETLD